MTSPADMNRQKHLHTADQVHDQSSRLLAPNASFFRRSYSLNPSSSSTSPGPLHQRSAVVLPVAQSSARTVVADHRLPCRFSSCAIPIYLQRTLLSRDKRLYLSRLRIQRSVASENSFSNSSFLGILWHRRNNKPLLQTLTPLRRQRVHIAIRPSFCPFRLLSQHSPPPSAASTPDRDLSKALTQKCLIDCEITLRHPRSLTSEPCSTTQAWHPVAVPLSLLLLSP